MPARSPNQSLRVGEVCPDRSPRLLRSRYTGAAGRSTVHPIRPSLPWPIFVPPASVPTPPAVPDKDVSAKRRFSLLSCSGFFEAAATQAPLGPVSRSHREDPQDSRPSATPPAPREFLQSR